ncbi:UDP-glucuronosyl/UDP-glucosyltransferase [Trinorchestia longiramus]|nr:UDP-glucuronosyl/UDP-glucosyltransferase [Trinorchestia longiramus]
MKPKELTHIMLPLILFTSSVAYTESYRILLSVPVASKSLHNLIGAVALSLANAGHDVTLISSYPASAHHKKLRNVYALGNATLPYKNLFEVKDQFGVYNLLLNLILFAGERMWENSEIRNIWDHRNDYDAFISPSYINEINLPFVMNYTGNFMLISTPGIEYFTISNLGNWLPPSVVPYILLPYDEHMTFLERLVNVVSLAVARIIVPLVLFDQQEKLLQKYFPDFTDVLSYYDRATLTLINGHPALDNPVPLLPNQVYIGTINAQPPMPLPKDLEEFVSGSGDAGLIYFSIGSVARSEDIPDRAKKAFVEAFSRLPQRVIWKYEGDDILLPPNVITRKWLPQQDILGHPKTRLFISHCGNLGTQEAKYHGVPVLAVPITFDQPRNAARMVYKGLALSLDWHSLSSDDVITAVDRLINDTAFSERIKKVSSILKDQMEPPSTRAVWWVEHFIRQGGAPYLQYPGKNLHFLQYTCIDVLLFIFVTLFISWKLCFFCFRRTWLSLAKLQDQKNRNKIRKKQK